MKVEPRIIILIVLLWVGQSCGNDAFRDEKFSKTRPLGMASSPVALSPGQEATLTLHVAASPGTTPSWSEVNLTYMSVDGTNKTIDVDAVFEKQNDYSSLSHFSGNLNFTVPSADDIGANALKGAPIFYVLTFSDGSRPIDVQGKALVYGEGHEALGYQDHSLSIDTPSNNASVGKSKQDLRGTLTKAQEERVKVSWIVPNGKVENRRDLTTVWEPDTSGPATVILSIRGRKSQAMRLVFHDILIQ